MNWRTVLLQRHEFLLGWTGVQTKVSECVMYWCEFIASKKMDPITVDKFTAEERS